MPITIDWEALRARLIRDFDEDTTQYVLLKLWQRTNDPNKPDIYNVLGYCISAAKRKRNRVYGRNRLFAPYTTDLSETQDVSLLRKLRNNITPERQAIARQELQKAPLALLQIELGGDVPAPRWLIHRLRIKRQTIKKQEEK